MLIKKKARLDLFGCDPQGSLYGAPQFSAGAARNLWRGSGLQELSESCGCAGPVGSVPVKLNGLVQGPYSKDNISEKVTPEQDVTHYNNYYEFGTDKSDPVQKRRQFRDNALERLGGRRSGEAADVYHGRDFEAGSA